MDNPFGGLLVGFVGGVELVQQVDGLAGRVIVEANEGEGIRKPAPVHALVDPVEALHLVISDRAELEVVEDAAAGADGLAEILVLIAAGVAVAEFLRLTDELLAQPGRIVQIQITAAVLDPVGPGLSGVQVCPVIPGEGRVVGLEVPEHRPATHGGLQDAVDLRTAGELVLLLEVRDRDVAERGWSC